MKRGKKRKKLGKKKTENNLRREKKKFANKLVVVIIIIIFFLILAKGIFFVLEIISKEIEEKPGLKGELPSLKGFGFEFEETEFLRVNCSDENLKKVWDFSFWESSDGINIVSDKSNEEICNYSLMYKVIDENVAYFIFYVSEERDYYVQRLSYGFYGNFTTEFLNILQNTNQYYLEDFFNNYVEDFFWDTQYVYGYRGIENVSEANSEYGKIFRIENGSWIYYYRSNNKSYYGFEEELSSQGKVAIIYENLTMDIFAYYERINKPINLTQIKDIENMIIYGSGSYPYYYLDLDNYFDNLGYEDYNLSIRYNIPFGSPPVGFFYSYYSHYVRFDTSNTVGGDFTMNITLSHPDYNSGENITTNSFNVTIYGCLDSDDGRYDFSTKGTAKNLTYNGTDSCYNNASVIEYWCENEIVRSSPYDCGSNKICVEGECVSNISGEINHAPDFLSGCEDIEWTMNYSYELNMEDCFEDDDNDVLTFRYENASTVNLSIYKDNDVLTLTPTTNWKGSGYFYIYANDSKEETQGRVDFIVNYTIATIHCGDEICNGNENCSTCSSDCGSCQEAAPEIKNASPSTGGVSISLGGNQTFSIEAENYDSIVWYLDGAIVARDVSSYEFNDEMLNEGEYEVKVEIKKGEGVVSKIWNLKVEREEKPRDPKIYFIIIFVVLGVLILIVVLLIIKSVMEKNEESNSPIIKSSFMPVQQSRYHNFPSR